MNVRRLVVLLTIAGLTGLAAPAAAGGTPAAAGSAASSGTGDSRVTIGSPHGQFPRNKQNEPAVGVARSAADPLLLAAGANEEVDVAPCRGSACPFTPGVGNSGVYFSVDGGGSWVQPTYTGWTARNGSPTSGRSGRCPATTRRAW